MKYRRLVIFTVVLLSMFIITSQISGAGPVTVKVMHQFNDAENAKFEAIVAQFEKDNPGIKIDLERDNSPASSYYGKLVTTIIGAAAPDIARVEPPKAAQYTAAGYTAKLDSYVSYEFYKSLFPGTLEPVLKNGSLYGIPQDISTLVLFYRTDMLAEAGYDSPPATWDELVEVAQAITKDTDGDGEIDVWGLGLFGGWGAFEFYPWFWAAGAEMFKEKDGKLIPAFSSSEGIAALQFWVDLIYKYKVIPEGAVTYTEDDYKGPFIAKKMAMFTSGPWTVASLKENKAIEGKWAIAPIPTGKRGASVLGGMHFIVLEQSEHKVEAMKFLNYFMQTDVQIDWAKSLNLLPIRSSCYDDPFFSRDPLMQAFAVQLTVAKSRPTIPEAGEIDNLFGQAWQAALARVKTPKEALDEAAEKAIEILSH